MRNRIAHLDLLRKSKWISNTDQKYSVVEDNLNCLRTLLSYDQKRMNAVTKTIQNIFDKHGVIVKFKMEGGGKVKLECVQPKNIEHLKKSRFAKQMPVKIPSHGVTFLSSLKELMQYPNGLNANKQ